MVPFCLGSNSLSPAVSRHRLPAGGTLPDWPRGSQARPVVKRRWEYSGRCLAQKAQLPTTPAESDSGHEAQPAKSRYQPLLDDVRASSFQTVTPGTTAESDLERELGKPLSRRQEGDETIYQFRVGPFPQIEVVVRSGVVVRVIVNMPRPVPLDQVTQELRLGDFSPVAIIDEMGQPLAIAYPERGVMLMLAPHASRQTVLQLVLEAISAEPFWRRAESDTTHAWAKQLLDLDYAVKLDPGCAEAHWRKAEILLAAGQFEEALASLERAVKLEPETHVYRLTRALILRETGRARDAAVEIQHIVKDAGGSSYVRGFAYHQLATLLTTPPKSQVAEALKHRLSAVQLLAPAASDSRVALRRQARLLLVHIYLHIAQDVAMGEWSDKPEAVNKWLRGAGEIAEAMVEQDGAGDWVRFLVLRQGLAAQAAHGQVDAGLKVDPALELGESLIKTAQDELYQRSLKRDFARLLFDAAIVVQAQGDSSRSRELAARAVALCEESLHGQPLSPSQEAWIGRLYYHVGSLHAVGDDNHREAIRWYERLTIAVPCCPCRAEWPARRAWRTAGEHGGLLLGGGRSQRGGQTERGGTRRDGQNIASRPSRASRAGSALLQSVVHVHRTGQAGRSAKNGRPGLESGAGDFVGGALRRG